MSLFEIISILIAYFFYTCIVLGCNSYIYRSIYFIKPMSQKYKIIAHDLSNDIKDRYSRIAFCTIFILFYLFLCLCINVVIFVASLALILIHTLVKINDYKKYTLLDYINEFSTDLFDWYDIYDLDIDIDLKKACFDQHRVDYARTEIDYNVLRDYELRR